MSDLGPGDALPPLVVETDLATTEAYAAASGDANPIHLDEAFARSVGLPGRILHGLWTMAQVARAQTEGAGVPPEALKALSVEFRGLGLPGESIHVESKVEGVADGMLRTSAVVKQAGKRIVRNGMAELLPPDA